MVKFEVVAPLRNIVLLQGKEVCDVTEFRMSNPIAGQFVAWRGSVKEEYFLIIFAKGMLTVSVAERECQVNEMAVNYAISDVFSKAMKEATKDPFKDTLVSFEYCNNQWPKDLKEVSFTDVMVALDWRYVPNAKIYYDMLN